MVNLARPVSVKFLYGSCGIFFAYHLILWLMVAVNHGISWESFLGGFDSSHFVTIATTGYSGSEWAFYPLYPLLLKLSRYLFGGMLPLQVLGAITSPLLFLVTLGLVIAALKVQIATNRGTAMINAGLLPVTRLGWLFFLFSPASYIFHSNHSESLYLLLSYAAFYFCYHRAWFLASVCAGFAALTRNHGVLLALMVAYWSTFRARGFCTVRDVIPSEQREHDVIPSEQREHDVIPSEQREHDVIPSEQREHDVIPSEQRERPGISIPSRFLKVRNFFTYGIVSLLFFICFPIYQYLAAGDALLFIKSHHHWGAADSVVQYLATFWFGNAQQNMNLGSIARHVYVWLIPLSAFWWFRLNPAIGLYLFSYFLLMPMQREFVDVFRFSAVLFSGLFTLGDKLSRQPKWLQISCLLLMLFIHHHVTRNYVLGRWAY